jgi:hypothetical protein
VLLFAQEGVDSFENPYVDEISVVYANWQL